MTQNQLYLIIALAVSKQHSLWQGDVKNAFCNGILPLEETVICMPPRDCPFSAPNTYWKLKKTLYGLAKSPVHWFRTIEKVFHSMGLCNHSNRPSLFCRTFIPDHPPIYIGLYVNDFCHFSTPDLVENKFRVLLNQHFTVTWDSELEWFLSIRFNWWHDENGATTACHLSQEALSKISSLATVY